MIPVASVYPASSSSSAVASAISSTKSRSHDPDVGGKGLGRDCQNAMKKLPFKTGQSPNTEEREMKVRFDLVSEPWWPAPPGR